MSILDKNTGPAPLADLMRAVTKADVPLSVGDVLKFEVAFIGNSGERYFRCWIERGGAVTPQDVVPHLCNSVNPNDCSRPGHDEALEAE